MHKGFSIINIIIIIGVIALSFLIYKDFIKKSQTKEIAQEKNVQIDINQEISNKTEQNQQPISTRSSAAKLSPEPAQPKEPTEPKKQTPQPTQPPPKEEPTTKNGLYQNLTYNYKITCPPDWPLRVRSEDNVSIGTVPPKNGQGAITIKATSSPEVTNEIEQAKTESKKYLGMVSISETPITLAGIEGVKIILKNLIAKTTNIYIMLEKYGFTYVIKYSEESTDFVNQVNTALQTFQFTK